MAGTRGRLCMMAFGWMGIPGAAGLRLNVSEACAWRGIWNADQHMAAGAFDLAAGVAGIAFQGLITVGTIEFEIGVAHIISPCANRLEKVCAISDILLPARLRMYGQIRKSGPL